mmetsp:Transcript_34569/g.89629  ORF Transcript_34569/g.89629 Transcript_34569/m.89629 type:complete len:90 (-) Transcript_34569:20-289(-)
MKRKTLALMCPIFADINMPGSIDGLMLARIARKIGISCPVIAVSARGDAKIRLDCEASGIDEVLVKPVAKGSVKDYLLQAIANHAQLRE